ncbi:hypothetical protein [Halovenus sp. HT40]|uniref:hypothetical protein n=1 Tax=Halovenus sp. HT40 TaxID=3126691 RepID=UPI00300EB33F
MDPEVKSSLLWGVVGGLAFLVLLQGYQLLADQFVSVELVAGVAVAVGAVTATVAQLLRPRLRARSVE